MIPIDDANCKDTEINPRGSLHGILFTMIHTNKIHINNREYTLYNRKYKQLILLTIYMLPSLLQRVILGSFISLLPWYFTQYLSLSLCFFLLRPILPFHYPCMPLPFSSSLSFSLRLCSYPSNYPVPFPKISGIFLLLYQFPLLLILEF